MATLKPRRRELSQARQDERNKAFQEGAALVSEAKAEFELSGTCPVCGQSRAAKAPARKSPAKKAGGTSAARAKAKS